MNRKIVLVLLFGLLCARELSAAGSIRRFVLAAGANNGGVERELLRYAVSDAENFVDVLEKMGGLDPADRILLRNPDLVEIQRGLEELRQRVNAAARWGGGRQEVLIYYSGHADDRGLLLGGERLAYRRLRRELEGIPADVHIAILDACASGSITRLKGGKRHQSFLVDESSDMRGFAFLTSSSADETSQESDNIQASFFTHYLVSGMRGAADATGDGRVTLNEVYQFAFDETLARTTGTQGGSQHPVCEIEMSGTGGVVMTDVRQTTAGLVLGEELSGRFYVRNVDQQLVAELFKPAGKVVELGLEPGDYTIHLETEPELRVSILELLEGQRLELSRDDFQAVSRERTVLRGGEEGRVKVAISENFNLDIETREGYIFSLGLFFNYQDKPFRGAQASWLVNQAREMAGSQVCAFGNLAQKDLKGWQLSGMVNWTVGALQGGQISGIVNIGHQVRGWQLSGSTNIAKRIQGWQIAAATNIAKEIKGIQIGAFNAAKKVKGWQIGVVNLSEEIDGVPLGIFNYSRTGLFNLSGWRDELGFNYVTLISGSRTFYTAFSAGCKMPVDDEAIFALGFAAGRHFDYGWGYTDVEIGQYAIASEFDDSHDVDLLARMRFVGGWKFGSEWSIFSGFSFSALWPDGAKPLVAPREDITINYDDDALLWPGFFAGIRYGR